MTLRQFAKRQSGKWQVAKNIANKKVTLHAPGIKEIKRYNSSVGPTFIKKITSVIYESL